MFADYSFENLDDQSSSGQLVARIGDVAEVCDALLMFEGFNARADQVVVHAQPSARDLGHRSSTFWDGRPRW